MRSGRWPTVDHRQSWTSMNIYGPRWKVFDGPVISEKQAFVGEVPPGLSEVDTKATCSRKAPRNTRTKKGKGRKQEVSSFGGSDAKASQVPLGKALARLGTSTPQRYRVVIRNKGPEESGKFAGNVCLPQNARWQLGQFAMHAANCGRECSQTGGRWKFLCQQSSSCRRWLELRELLVESAFGRPWKVEACFGKRRKAGLGSLRMSRLGPCVHRHMIVTVVAQLFWRRVRHKLVPANVTDAERF